MAAVSRSPAQVVLLCNGILHHQSLKSKVSAIELLVIPLKEYSISNNLFFDSGGTIQGSVGASLLWYHNNRHKTLMAICGQ